MSLQQTRFNGVADFFSDRNGTINFSIPQDFTEVRTFGTCGLRPDECLMAKEHSDGFDELADKFGWYDKERRIEESIYNLTGRVNRKAWLENQIHEARYGQKVDISTMTSSELSWFLTQLDKIKTARRKRKL